MFHFTIFGGSEVTLTGGSQFIFTLFGGTDVRRPTLAKRLVQEKHLLQANRPPANYSPDGVDKVLNFIKGDPTYGRPDAPNNGKCFLLTIFGGVEIFPPSIAEEFMDMRELISSGLLDPGEWDQLVGRLYQMGELDSISSFTLFGGMGEADVDEQEEIKKISSACGMGLINQEEEKALRSVVGRDPQQVRMLLRQTAFA